MRSRLLLLLSAALLVQCASSSTDDETPSPGPSRAGQLTTANAAEVVPPGSTAAARPGDWFLRNEHATFIIQRAGRELALGPYGGSVIDVALAGGSDYFGELIPGLALGRTIRVEEVRVVDDGTTGTGPAVLEAKGIDAANVYYNLEGIEPNLLSYTPDGSGLLGFDPDASLHLEITIRYELPADEARLAITYTVKNVGDERVGVPFAFLVDSRGDLESYMPGPGFSSVLTKSVDPETIVSQLAQIESTELTLLGNTEMALGIVPRAVNAKSPPRTIGTFIPGIAGALFLEVDNALAATTDPSFHVNPGEEGTVVVDIIAARRPQDVLSRTWELLGTALGDVEGCVTSPAGTPVAGVRVGLNSAARGSIAYFDTDADGCFAGRVPPGDYTAVAGAMYRVASDPVAVTVPGSVSLTVPDLGTLEVAVDVFDALDATTPSPHPCRLTLIGERQVTSHPDLGEAWVTDAGGEVHRMWRLRTCAESFTVVPGRYLAFVSRGPEFDRIETLVDIVAGQSTALSGSLHRVVDSAGYAASDFHVHAIYSPDSAVPTADRVLSMAVEGMDFWASTEHDVVVDYTQEIEALGLQDDLLTIAGAEVTTFDTGHFGAYPLDVVADQFNGGTPDWAPRDDGVRPTMQELFDDIHARGSLVQVNHPRSGGTAMQAYFSRAALRFDPVTGAPYADPAAQRVPNDILRYPPGLVYFSDDFDIIEVMNGIGTFRAQDMTYDSGAERAGHDWMNLLSFGRPIVAVGNSDTHTLGGPPGNPRTMVGGHDGGIAGLVTSLTHGDAIATSGPMVRATLVDGGGAVAGLGDVLEPASSAVTLHVEVQTADWYEVSAVEVIANVFFADPTSNDPPPRAVPLVPVVPVEVARPNGGTAKVVEVDIPLDLDAPPFNGQDSWLAVRVGGTVPMYPVMIDGGGILDTSATTPETFLSGRWGPLPFAMTNAIYVDADRDGSTPWR